MLSVYRTAAGTKYVCFKYFIDASISFCFSVKLVILFIFFVKILIHVKLDEKVKKNQPVCVQMYLWS